LRIRVSCFISKPTNTEPDLTKLLRNRNFNIFCLYGRRRRQVTDLLLCSVCAHQNAQLGNNNLRTVNQHTL